MFACLFAAAGAHKNRSVNGIYSQQLAYIYRRAHNKRKWRFSESKHFLEYGSGIS